MFKERLVTVYLKGYSNDWLWWLGAPDSALCNNYRPQYQWSMRSCWALAWFRWRPYLKNAVSILSNSQIRTKCLFYDTCKRMREQARDRERKKNDAKIAPFSQFFVKQKFGSHAAVIVENSFALPHFCFKRRNRFCVI